MKMNSILLSLSRTRKQKTSAKRRNHFALGGSIAMLAVSGFSLGSPSGAIAADNFWNAGSGADFSWDNGLNWSLNAEPISTDDVIFVKPIPNPNALANPDVITLTTGSVANSLSFFAPYTLTGGDLALTTGRIRVTIGNASTIASMLTGSGGLLKLNDGALFLTNAANNYTGTTRIEEGSVVVTSQGALGSDTSAVVVSGNTTRGSGGGSLVIGSANNNLAGGTFTRDLALTGGGASGDGAAFISVGNNIITGNIVTGGNPAGLNPVSGTAFTASGTRLAATFGTTTVNGLLTIEPTGQATEFTGNGNWIVNSNITGLGNLTKTGNGLLVLTGNNSFGGILTSSGGYVRVSSAANLGANVGNGAITTNAGRTEFRSDAPDFTTATRWTQGTSTFASNIYLDRAVGGSGINQTVTMGLLTLTTSTNARSLVVNGRNGYGMTFTGNMAAGSNGNYTLTNSTNGLLTFAGNFYNTNNGTKRDFTINGNGDTIVTGNLLATGNATHEFSKGGTGTLVVDGTGSNYGGITNINAGALQIRDFRSINNNTARIDLGTTTIAGTLTIGTTQAATAAGLTTSKVINLSGTTGAVAINASQAGTDPVILNGAITATGGTAANAKVLSLGGTSTAGNIINTGIPNNAAGGTVSVTKVNAGTWILAGANTYTGVTTITNGTLALKMNAPTSTVLPSTNAIAFGNANVDGGGTLELIGQDGVNNVQSIATMTSSSGAGTVKLTPGASSGTVSLTIGNLTTGGAVTINVVGADFTNNKVTVNQLNGSAGSPGIVSRTVYWNGADYAFRDASLVLRAPVYGTDTATAVAAASLTSANHNLVTGSFATNTLSVNTLKFGSPQALTINSGQTLTLSNGGVLAAGGASSISGGTLALGTQTLVVRTDLVTDTMTITSNITGTTGGLTKGGAGTLILEGGNVLGGTISLNEGTIKLAGSGSLSGTAALTMRQNTVLDFNGVTPSSNINAFNVNGIITNNGASPVVFTVGGSNGTGAVNGILQDGTSGLGGLGITKIGTGGQTWNGASTYTGVTTIGSTGKVTTALLANIGQPSGIGAGDSTSAATNAASLVFNGTTGGIIYNGRDSVSTNRLFTLAGTGANSGATLDASGTNSSTVIFSNPGNVVYGVGAVAQTLILTGNSTGDNEIKMGLLDNGTNALSITKDNTGLWILSGAANTYSGPTSLVRGVLRAVDGAGLSPNSALSFDATGANFSVLESTGTFTRALGTGRGR